MQQITTFKKKEEQKVKMKKKCISWLLDDFKVGEGYFTLNLMAAKSANFTYTCVYVHGQPFIQEVILPCSR